MGWVRGMVLGVGLTGAAARADEVVVVPLSALVPAVRPAEARAPVVAAWDALDAAFAVPAPGAAAGELRWEGRLRVYEGGRPFAVPLGAGIVLAGLTLDGRPPPPGLAVHTEGGALVLRGALPAGVVRVAVRAAVPSAGASVAFDLPPAPRAALRAEAPGLRVAGERLVSRGRGRFDVPGGGAVALGWSADGPPPPRPRALLADAGVELRVEPGALDGRARVRGRVANGSVDEISIDFGRPVSEVRVEGPGLGPAVVAGSRVQVPFLSPREGAFELDLHFRVVGAGPAPLPVVEGARGRLYVGVLEDTGVLAAPRPLARLEPVSADAVPGWARGLVEGRPLVRYVGDGSGAQLELGALAWTPVDAPPTVVDDAHYQAVYAGHGRVYLRAALLVRNDRGPYLAVQAPQGARLAGARVAGRTAAVAQRADGAWLVPLERSVESLDGLVQFPVDLLFMGEGPAWSARGVRRIAAPSLDAPIAAMRWEVTLPGDRRARRAEGAGRVVADFTAEGLAFGRGTRAATPAAEAAPVQAAADKRASVETWNAAYRAYQENDFDAAEALLDQSLKLDADNAAARSLQGNVDLLLGKKQAASPEEAGAARRVRELAKAKTGDLEVKQEELSNALKEAELRGDSAAAADTAQALLSVTRSLSIVETETAVEQKNMLKSLEARADGKGAKGGAGWPGVASSASTTAATPAPQTGYAGDFLFEDVEIAGALLQPDDAPNEGPPRGLGLSGFGRGGGGAAEAVADEDAEDLSGASTLDNLYLSEGEVAILLPAPSAPVERSAPVEEERPLPGRAPVATPPPPPPPPPAAADAPEAVEVVERDFLENIPAGRSFQATVAEVHVVSGRARAPRKAESAKDAAARGPTPSAAAPPAAAPLPAWGLPIPEGIRATTLSLSLPVDTVDLRVEQQLLPPGEAPVLDLTVRPRRSR